MVLNGDSLVVLVGGDLKILLASVVKVLVVKVTDGRHVPTNEQEVINYLSDGVFVFLVVKDTLI